MSDDQDGCEWVSVSSGTGLLDCPGQKPLNGCVCACVCVCVSVQVSQDGIAVVSQQHPVP